jgi:hypothetical protein
MADTTIKVESAVRDRLAVLAAERGVTIRDLVEELARATPIRKDLEARHAAAMAYLREHVCPDLVESDARAGERFWRELEADRSPSLISEVAQVPRPRR